MSQYCLLPLLKQFLIRKLFHPLSKSYSFDVLNYSHYWKNPKNIVESENIKFNFTLSDSGIIFILYSLQFTEQAWFWISSKTNRQSCNSIFRSNLTMTSPGTTVKLVCSKHLRFLKNVSIITRCPLYRGFYNLNKIFETSSSFYVK